MNRILSLLFRGLALAAPAALLVFAQPASAQSAAATSANYPYKASRPVPGRYIVVLKNDVTDPAESAATLVRSHGGQLHHTYKAVLKGFSATLPEAALNGIRNNPHVAYIEQDQTVSLQQSSPQNQVTWGLDRIDQVDRPLDTQYHFGTSGAGVTAFIVDTGIRADHTEFTGRLLAGLDTVGDGNGTNDCNGHGTHVAGTVGGVTWGVAKGVSLVPVRVLDCAGTGSWSQVIAGIDWVANSTKRPAVANMSLGGSPSASLDAALAGAVAKGVTVVVAAGNNNVDACTASPAREPSAITVGATTTLDARASYSNWGSCVDLFAPGSGITSAWNTGASASNTIGGTSMASPHVAGVAALVLAANPSATPAAVAALLVSSATPNRLVPTVMGPGSPNLLVYSMLGSAPPVQPATQTVAFKSMAGSSAKTGGNWKASAAITVRNINTGANVANATVTANFSVGGAATCTTNSSGNCTLTSGPIKMNGATSTALTATGITGTLMTYDASQNTVSQIVIARP